MGKNEKLTLIIRDISRYMHTAGRCVGQGMRDPAAVSDDEEVLVQRL